MSISVENISYNTQKSAFASSKIESAYSVAEKTKTGVKKTDNSLIEDKAEISEEGMNLYKQEKAQEGKESEESNSSNSTGETKELTDEEKLEVTELKNTDAKVKRHEQAHIAASGGLIAGSPQYKYEEGPDGEKYAVSGEVELTIKEESDPEKTIERAQKVKRAALAPEDPSPQDLKVAQQADQMIQKAKAELLKEGSSEENNS